MDLPTVLGADTKGKINSSVVQGEFPEIPELQSVATLFARSEPA
jgi:hypothetical protein